MDNKLPVTLVECPRDAMQGWPIFIPTIKKIEYLNSLLQVGFDTLDFGSFVSATAIPQLADTKEVLSELALGSTSTKLLAIVANQRGATNALEHTQIKYIGFPFSISETFQLRNTNSTIEQSITRVSDINKLCAGTNTEMVVYMSMGFGNPYGDEYNLSKLYYWIDRMLQLGIKHISIADTVAIATPPLIEEVVHGVATRFPKMPFGLHLHSTQQSIIEKLQAAYNAGCRRYDGALKGIGGCPMSGNELVGNIDTEIMYNYFNQIGAAPVINVAALNKSVDIANDLFN